MTTFGNAGRVGLLFVVALALTVGLWFYLQGSILNRNTYSFDVLFTDASGVTAETPVTLAGVQIGKVASVTLTPTQQADLKLEIKDKLNGRDVRIPRGSQFLISTPVLGTSGTILVGEVRFGRPNVERDPQTRPIPNVDEAAFHDRVRQSFHDLIPPLRLAHRILKSDVILR